MYFNSSRFINPELAALAEQTGSLPDIWLQEIYDQKLFKIFVPKVLGGLEMDLIAGLRLEEELAKSDASLGWTITLCAGAGWFVGFLKKSLREVIFSDPKACLAGSGHVGGKADFSEGSYKVSGHWTYASGALHATHFTANCVLLENGKSMLAPDGKPKVAAFLLKKDEVEILDGWNYMGMIATGSHAFKTDKIIVPADRCFEILPEKVKLQHPIYSFPFLQFAEATLVVNIVGITFHLQKLIADSFWIRNESRKFTKKEVSHFKKLIVRETKRVELSKSIFYDAVSVAWSELIKSGEISKEALKKVSVTSRKLTQVCRASNAKLYPFAGLEAAKTQTELNRVWRDFNTVSQHSLLTFPF